MKCSLVTVALAATALFLFAGQASATTPSDRFGIQDDAWLRWGPGKPDSTPLASRLNTLDVLGVKIVRFTIVWTRRYPWVRMWTAWNEANLRLFAAPVSPMLYVRNVLNPAWAALHRANRANRVAGGVTSPRRTPSGMAPVAFAEGMRRAHARLDAYAANPFPGNRNETLFHDPCRNCQTLNMARLGKTRRLVTRLWGVRTPLWLTEYAYETNPRTEREGSRGRGKRCSSARARCACGSSMVRPC